MPKLERNQNCEDKWITKVCKNKKKRGHCKIKKVAKNCPHTCKKCPPIICPGYSIPKDDGSCICPGNTIDNGNGNCNCVGDIVNDRVGDCSCPGDTEDDGLGTFPFCFPTNGNIFCFKVQKSTKIKQSRIIKKK